MTFQHIQKAIMSRLDSILLHVLPQVPHTLSMFHSRVHVVYSSLYSFARISTNDQTCYVWTICVGKVLPCRHVLGPPIRQAEKRPISNNQLHISVI